MMLGNAAYAADAVVVETPTEQPAPVFVWTGGYVGLAGGFGWAEVDIDSSVFGIPQDPESLDGQGGFVGLHAGYNFQSGYFVGGIEADINKSWVDSNAMLDTVEVDAELDWFGSIRGRAGVALDRTLVFGTAGVAFADASAELLGEKLDLSYTGWTVGAGAEYALTDNFTLRGEYRYYDFGSDRLEVGGGFLAFEAALRMQTISFGASYKF